MTSGVLRLFNGPEGRANGGRGQQRPRQCRQKSDFDGPPGSHQGFMMRLASGMTKRSSSALFLGFGTWEEKEWGQGLRSERILQR
eukprot:CAMPEP_0174368788 /NCGR_PEP_ID=MMETSP0811_2-20130205/90163_1 /TAXON_ID=73025 ORGANISM="Eutreptiella gymnastica-like, Strain CCMP1594" /NCGR_SAMPLE_ID=MMETSP0811_2 /ASSEMBLY_ACC=CAM_ASM_000667 /LENGTH=84 /DNA_ID=CAMNT_0015512567 /DNA_START=135 /DNA_END=390 /DNA_ORIENTATION=-